MQAVSESFHRKSQAGVRKHRWSLLMSFEKDFDDSRTFFTLDQSQMNGTDVLAPVGESPIQFWDFYNYEPYGDRVISMEWERGVSFPYSVQSSVATVVLNNSDNLFSSRTNSPLSQYVIPGRPTKVLTGYENESLVQQFVGLTQSKPVLDHTARTAEFNSLDYLTEIFKLSLSDSIAMSNVRTNEVLEALFSQFGIESYQYNLEQGRNKIPFLFLDEGLSAADAINQIMQAEGGQLWIDEQGIIRFNRRSALAPDPVFRFNKSNIVSITGTEDTEIVNRVTVKTNIRSLQQSQPIHTGSGNTGDGNLSETIAILPNSVIDYNISLNDPLGGFTIPTVGEKTGDSWFTVASGTGQPITDNVTVSDSKLTVGQLTVSIYNANPFTVYLNAIEVWGTPARIIDTLYYQGYDKDSIDQYGEQLLEVENDMFGSESNCESFVYSILSENSTFDSIIEMSVKGNPALQLNDIILVETDRISGYFQITKLSNSISSSGAVQTIKAKRRDPRSWFILNKSVLNGEDIMAP